MHKTLPIYCLLILCAGPVWGAENPQDFFLLPIAPLESRGAFLTTWKVRVNYRYDGERAIELVGPAGLQQLQPRTVGGLEVRPVDAPGFLGRLIAVPADQAPALFIQEHVFEASVPAGGIAVPAVRSNSIAIGRTVHLVGIPVSENSRTMIRIYDASLAAFAADVLVTVTSLDGTTYSDVVHLDSPPISYSQHFPLVPIYAEYHPRASATGVLFIDVKPLTNGALRLWAFATTTDNRTQAIVGVFPAN